MARETALDPEERIDRLAKRLYGTEQGGTVEAMLAATPGLAANGLFVPGGTAVSTPDPEPADRPGDVRPWE